MRNRKKLKLNIILLVALAIAGIIFFVIFENKEETSIVGATKVYDTWIGFDGASTSHGAQYSLEVDPNWLCCDHGSPLPGWAKSLSMNDYIDMNTFDRPYINMIEDNGVIYAEQTTRSLGELDLSTTRPGDEPSIWGYHTYREPEGASGNGFGFTKDEYNFITFGDYNSEGSKAATPMEAYILGQGNISYSNSLVQQAWWMTEANEGQNEGDNSLSVIAREFESYVVSITGSASEKTGGFISESQFNLKVSLDSSSATVSFNENNQKYYVGPFTLTYPDSQFCYISSATLTVDVKTDTKTYKVGNNWNFYNISGTFPLSGEKFYVELNYIEGMSEIQGMQFDFFYTDASGSYTKYRGNYYIHHYSYNDEVDWVLNARAVVHYRDVYFDDGHEEYPDVGYSYWSAVFDTFFRTESAAKAWFSQYTFDTEFSNDYDDYVHYIWVTLETNDIDLHHNSIQEDSCSSPHAQTLCRAGGNCWVTTNNPASKSINLSIDLTMRMGGTVWNDTSDKDGKVNSGEGIEGVKVTLYRVYSSGKEYKEAYVFDNNNKKIDYYTYTDSSGKWSFDRVAVPATGTSGSPVYYSVYYEYDGQTYEPTQVVNSASSFKKATTEDRNKSPYPTSSMAQDKSDSAALITSSDDTEDRKTFNESFTYIEGNSAINANTGKTSGVAYDESRESSKPLNYSSQDSLSNYGTGNSRKVSTLDTVDLTSNFPYSQYRLTAKTQYSDLLFPLDSLFHINENDKTLSNGTYRAIYKYVNNINFGLVERETADISVEKDLTEITTVVNGKVMKYEYAAALGIDEGATISDIIQKQLEVMDADITYTLNVYRSDYYYRASVYGDSTKENNTVAAALDKFYTSIGFDAETYYWNNGNRYSYEENRYGAGSTELEIYLTYTIRVHNEEKDTEYDVRINNLTDYYDSTLTPINNDAEAKIYSNVYVQTLNGEEVNDVVTLTKGPEITFYEINNKTITTIKDTSTFEWKVPSNGIKETGETSGGVKYTAVQTEAANVMKLSAGQCAELVTTYKVNKSTADNGVTNAIELGAKQNVAEVQSYTTYFKKNTSIWADEGEIAGRVDGDSAPGNVNTTDLYNEKLYEDDSDVTPTLNIQLTEDPNRRRRRRWIWRTESPEVAEVLGENADRTIDGLVWEDKRTVNQESEIDGENGKNGFAYNQTVGDGIYEGDENTIAGITTQLVEVIDIPNETGPGAVYREYEYVWNTSKTDIDGLGGHTIEDLTGLNSGYYTKVDPDDETKSVVETDENGEYSFTGVAAGNYRVRFVYGDKTIETEKTQPKVYNGQDYKSTAYQAGYDKDLYEKDEEGNFVLDENGNYVLADNGDYKLIHKGNDSDGDGYPDNEWHDLACKKLNTDRVSDARDDEARRLYITSKSEILTYDNAAVLATADDKDADHTRLFGKYQDAFETRTSTKDDDILGTTVEVAEEDPIDTGYYMFAETAKLNLEIEDVIQKTTYTGFLVGVFTDYNGNILHIYQLKGDITTSSKSEVDSLQGNKFKYEIKNIDFGIEERPVSDVILDKEIEEITFTTNDDVVILDAIYDIDYSFVDEENNEENEDENSNLIDGKIKATVSLNQEKSTGSSQIASLNKSENTKGYRYIMVESELLQGATIDVKYRLTAFNAGETDTCNQVLKDLWDEINRAYYSGRVLEDAIEMLDSPYYTHENGRVNYTKNEDGSLNININEAYQYGTYFGSIYYLGAYGRYDDETTIVAGTTVHEIIDYVDPDVEFIDLYNMTMDNSWSSYSIDQIIEMADNGKLNPEILTVIDESGTPKIDQTSGLKVTYADVKNGNYEFDESKDRYSIINDELQEYYTDTKDNIIISVDYGGPESDDDNEEELNYDLSNPSLTEEMIPFVAHTEDGEDGNEFEDHETPNPTYTVGDEEVEATTTIVKSKAYQEATGEIWLATSRYYSSEDDGEEIDNIAEIIKEENTVGRRNRMSVVGNMSTYELDYGTGDTPDDGDSDNPGGSTGDNPGDNPDGGTSGTSTPGPDDTIDLYEIAGEEPDGSATEIITLSPPTGMSVKESTTRLKSQVALTTLAVVAVAVIIAIIIIKKKPTKRYR